MAHAVKVIRPQFFIVDGIYEKKLREALNSEHYGDVTIMTMVSRLDGHLLVRIVPRPPHIHSNALTDTVPQRLDGEV